MLKKTLSLSVLLFSSLNYADCNNLLDLINSPSKIDSACSVPWKKVIMEANYVHEQLSISSGTQENAPNAAIRIGLPGHKELYIFPPNYISQSIEPRRGVSITSIGLKQSFSYTEKWLIALEAEADLPSGSYFYGAAKWGETFKGMFTYLITSQINLSGMLQFAHVSESAGAGGRTFNTINPILTLAYNPTDNTSLYGEIYGQSKIGFAEGYGLDYDVGMLYQINSSFLLDFSWSHKIHNNLGNYIDYISAGFGIML